MTVMKIIQMGALVLAIIIAAQATSVGLSISAGMVAFGLLILLVNDTFDPGDPV